MADIFQEIDEELRQDRAAKLWQRYGVYLIAAAVLVVAGVAGQSFWRDYQIGQREADSMRYEQAVRQASDKDAAGAAAAFASLIEDGGEGYRVLARFRQAALAAEGGDAEAAVLTYDAIKNDTAVPSLFRDLAVLLSVIRQAEGGDASALSQSLAPLTEADNPWRSMALEQQAVLAVKTGDVAKAREIFTGLADDAEVSRGVRARAAEMLKALPR